MYKNILFLLISIAFLSCAPKEKSKKQTLSKKNTEVAKSVTSTPLPYPPIPENDVKVMWEKCDFIDYLFYETNFTLSQDDQASIRQFLSFLANAPGNEGENCKSLGRVFFQEKGDVMYEAEFFFQKGCTYLVFLVDNKPKWSNQLTPQGKKFFMNLFKKAQGGNY